MFRQTILWSPELSREIIKKILPQSARKRHENWNDSIFLFGDIMVARKLYHTYLTNCFLLPAPSRTATTILLFIFVAASCFIKKGSHGHSLRPLVQSAPEEMEFDKAASFFFSDLFNIWLSRASLWRGLLRIW